MLRRLSVPKRVALGLRLGSYQWPRSISSSPSLARRHLIFEGRKTSEEDVDVFTKSPFYLDTGYAIFAKRPSRPFPPPFLSTPSHSFSDPLTTYQRFRDRGPSLDGHKIRGLTNGDDAILIGGQNFLVANDGVGAWAQKERGHAALWSRLIAHFWAEEVEKLYKVEDGGPLQLEQLDMVQCLQRAYDLTKDLTTENNEIVGTTTACSALLHHRNEDQPVILATTLGDCTVMVVRPGEEEILYKTKEQWHWFDCPRQLGTNSPDTPTVNAVTDIVDIKEGDVVLAVSDGLSDNLWENEVIEKVTEGMRKWKENVREAQDGPLFLARELMNSAREIAQDPNAESPYMERALDEGLSAFGGKLDDISVIVGVCKRRKQ